MAAPVRIVNAPRSVADAVEHPVTVHQFEGGWHGITYKTWQVSVSPDALIRLPATLKPEEVEDFVAVIRAAVPVSAEVKAAANAKADPRLVASERLLPGMPALPAAAKPAFTSERLAAAREKLRGAR